ncbi:MAG: hypothetical protein ACLQDY_09580 [Streptosporangiaceae bacterium]
MADGSALITLAHIGGLAGSVQAFGSGAGITEIGAVYLGAALIATASPTPGGLGAIEAALAQPGWDDYLAVALDELISFASGSLEVRSRIERLLGDLARLAPADRQAAIRVRRDRLRSPDGHPAR